MPAVKRGEPLPGDELGVGRVPWNPQSPNKDAVGQGWASGRWDGRSRSRRQILPVQV